MPKRLPIKDIVSGLVTSMARAVRYWFHYTLVAFAWLGVVPLTACKCLDLFYIHVGLILILLSHFCFVFLFLEKGFLDN